VPTTTPPPVFVSDYDFKDGVECEGRVDKANRTVRFSTQVINHGTGKFPAAKLVVQAAQNGVTYDDVRYIEPEWPLIITQPMRSEEVKVFWKTNDAGDVTFTANLYDTNSEGGDELQDVRTCTIKK
jgi:hypothetical protein